MPDDLLTGAAARRLLFFGCPVDTLSVAETLVWIEQAARGSRRPRQVSVVNANKFHMMRRDAKLRAVVEASDLVVPEWAIVWGARRLGLPPVPHSGGLLIARDFMPFAAERGLRPFLLGAQPDVVEELAARLRRDHPALALAGFHHGYLKTPAAEREVVRQVTASGADVLFVAMGSPAQELWIDRHKEEMGVPVSIGIGGTFDVLSGRKPDAPDWARGRGLEWLYRLAQDPRAYARRYLVTNAWFVGAVLRARLAGGRRAGGRGAIPAAPAGTTNRHRTTE